MFSEYNDAMDEYKEIKIFFKDNGIYGAELTSFIEEIQEHYELADRFNWTKSRRHYGDLLAKLIKNYGH